MMIFWIAAALAAVWFLQEFAYGKFWDKGLTARLFFLRERSGKEKKGSSVKPWRTEKCFPFLCSM